jgi:hypothetical protein
VTGAERISKFKWPMANGKPFEISPEKTGKCHPERSEGSLQLFVNHSAERNCGDPSLRSG